MHNSKRVEACRHVVQHYPRAFWNRLQLSHRWWLQDIEDTKKYNARQKRFPSERHGDQCHKLAGYLIDYDKLRIFYPGAACDSGGRRYPDQDNRCRQCNG